MKTRTLLALSFSTLLFLSACSTVDHGVQQFMYLSGISNEPPNECRLNPESCMYDGQYEAGEREYAEREARRLNKASAERLRRSAR